MYIVAQNKASDERLTDYLTFVCAMANESTAATLTLSEIQRRLERNDGLKPWCTIDSAQRVLSRLVGCDSCNIGRGTFGVCYGLSKGCAPHETLEASLAENTHWAIKLPTTERRELSPTDHDIAKEMNIASRFCNVTTASDSVGNTTISIVTHRGLLPCIPIFMETGMSTLLMPKGYGSLWDVMRMGDAGRRLLNLGSTAVLYDLVKAISKMHDMGLTHQDLKPGNIITFKDAQGNLRLRVSDFGATRPHYNSTQGLPGEKGIKGWCSTTLPYRCLESVLAGETLPRKDITADDVWAIGCILYEMTSPCLICSMPADISTYEGQQQYIAKRCVHLLGSSTVQGVTSDKVSDEIVKVLPQLQRMPVTGTLATAQLPRMKESECHPEFIHAASLALQHAAAGRPLTARALKDAIKEAVKKAEADLQREPAGSAKRVRDVVDLCQEEAEEATAEDLLERDVKRIKMH